MGKENRSLCKLEKEEGKNAKVVRKLRKQPGYECRKCNRLSSCEQNLCKPAAMQERASTDMTSDRPSQKKEKDKKSDKKSDKKKQMKKDKKKDKKKNSKKDKKKLKK